MKLANNTGLPPLPAWQARSTIAMALALLVTLCNLVGLDLLGLLADIGAGENADQVLDSAQRVIGAWQQVAPLAFGLWAWAERRAPNFRLVWPWGGKGGTT